MRGLTDKRMEQIRRAGACYAAAYLLMTIAMDYVDAGDDACKAAGFLRNEVKMESGRVQASFDRFCRAFDKYLGEGDSRAIQRDYEALAPEIEKILEVRL